MLMTHSVASLLLGTMIVLGAGEVFGQAYPNKPIRFVTAEVGGGGDFAARLIAPGISGPLGQPVIVENRNTYIGPVIVSKSPPDGYTLLWAGNILWLLPHMQDNVPSDKDFSPITTAQVSPNILVVNPSLPVKSVKELIALAKAKPGALNYSSSAAGTASHLSAELFKSMAGVNIVRIAYKGNGPAVLALVSGEVQFGFPSPGSSGPHIKSGKLRALAVTSARRSALYPDLPTVADGLPGYELTNITGLFVPAKTPAPIIRRLNQEIVRVLNSADVKEKILSTGVEPVTSSPEEFAAAIKLDSARLGKVIKDARIRAE